LCAGKKWSGEQTGKIQTDVNGLCVFMRVCTCKDGKGNINQSKRHSVPNVVAVGADECVGDVRACIHENVQVDGPKLASELHYVVCVSINGMNLFMRSQRHRAADAFEYENLIVFEQGIYKQTLSIFGFLTSESKYFSIVDPNNSSE